MERLEDHESRIATSEKRIAALEQNYSTLFNKVQTVETGVTRVENAVMVEGMENRKLIREMIGNQFNLDKKKLSAKEKVQLALIALVSTAVGGGGAVAIILHFFNK